MKNKKFFIENIVKICVAFFITCIAVVCINYLQDRISEWHQYNDSVSILQEVSDTLDSNTSTAQELSAMYHKGNLEILDNLKQMMQGDSTTNAIDTAASKSATKTSSAVVVNGSDKLNGLVQEDFAPYLFLVDAQGNVVSSADNSYVGQNLCSSGFFISDAFSQLLTCPDDGVMSNPYDGDEDYYFYATSMEPTLPGDYLIIGFDNDLFQERIASLTNLSTIIEKTNLANGEVMLAINSNDGTIIHCSSNDFDLMGNTVADAGIPESLLTDRGAATVTINGKDYLCASVAHSDDLVLVMAVSADIRLADNYKPTVWAIAILIMTLILAIHYAMLLPGDMKKTHKKQKVVQLFNSKFVVNLTAVSKALPLLALGLLLVFGSTFYCRTLLKLSWAMNDADRPLSQLDDELAQNEQEQQDVKDYCDQMYLSEAQMIANMIEVNPSCLNEATTKVYTQFTQSGTKQVLTDDEGNPLKSVPNSEQLQQLCESSGALKIQVYNDQGYMIADSDDTWNFQLSHDSDDQSSAFYDVILGKVDYLVQDAQEDEDGNYGQYVGVAFNYYTTKNSDGSTLYVSRLDYQNYLNGNWSGNPITAHQSVLQCATDVSIRQQMMESLDISYIMEHVALSNDAYMVVFDNSSDHTIIYTPNEGNIGKTAEELEISDDEFSGSFNGFQTVQGVEYYECCRFSNGYYVAVATPTASLYSTRLQSSLLVTLAALVMMILVMALIMVTSKENMAWLQAQTGKGALPTNGGGASTDVAVGGPRFIAEWRRTFNQKTAEEKITVMIRIFGMLIGLYFLVGICFGGLLFADNEALNYMLNGDWERGVNIFALTKSVLTLVVVVVCVEILNWFMHKVCSVFSSNAATIVNLLMSLVRYISVIAALFYSLYLFGMDAMSLLVSAGLLTLIIGLGAQSLISDMLSSVFIIFEGYYHVGDYIMIDKKPGFVEEIGIRSTRIRNLDNTITICNNSEIVEVVNMSVKNMLLKLKFTIASNESLERVEKILKQELPLFRERIPELVETPSYEGVVKVGTYKIELLIDFMCKGVDYRKVLYDVYREFKLLYERYDIKAPYVLEVVAGGGSLDELEEISDVPTNFHNPTDNTQIGGCSEEEIAGPVIQGSKDRPDKN